MPRILDGNRVRDEIKGELKPRIAALAAHGRPPGLAVVVGRSDIVGKPVAMLLLHEHATVTICHSKTPDLKSVCREADILVAAIGRAAMITGEFIKPGATVIDVGTNHVADREKAARIF